MSRIACIHFPVFNESIVPVFPYLFLSSFIVSATIDSLYPIAFFGAQG